MARKAVARRRKVKRKRRSAVKKLSRNKRPEGMSLENWQRELRRQFGRELDYRLDNLGDQPIFSEDGRRAVAADTRG